MPYVRLTVEMRCIANGHQGGRGGEASETNLAMKYGWASIEQEGLLKSKCCVFPSAQREAIKHASERKKQVVRYLTGSGS